MPVRSHDSASVVDAAPVAPVAPASSAIPASPASQVAPASPAAPLPTAPSAASPADIPTPPWTPSSVEAAHAAEARVMGMLAEELDACRSSFIALGDEARQLIFTQLCEHYGGLRVGELVEVVGLSRPTVSHHLRILREAGLVDRYSVGTKNYYHVSPNPERWQELAHLASGAERFVREVNRRRDEGLEPPFRRE